MNEDQNIKEEIRFKSSTLETIDSAFMIWLNEKLNLSIQTNDGFRKVPVLWLNPERAYQIKHNKELRDVHDVLIFPLITVRRDSFTKDVNKKGSAWGNIPPNSDQAGGSITISRQINQDKTSNFANAESLRRNSVINFPRRKTKKIVYQTKTIPMPTYIDIEYILEIKTEYQQHMNSLVTPFVTKGGGISYHTITSEQGPDDKNIGHRYEAFIQPDFSTEVFLDEVERGFKTTIKIKVLGYLIGNEDNQEQPRIVVRENAVEIKFGREKSFLNN